MNSLTVIASANSRLHADIILIRLRRAKIDCRKISVLFPTHSMPNAVGCWLPITSDPQLKLGGETIARAGQLREPVMAIAQSHDDKREIVDLLAHAGVDHPNARMLEERLEQGHILLCVHAVNEGEVATAQQVFRQSCSDTIIAGHQVASETERPRHLREIKKITSLIPVAA